MLVCRHISLPLPIAGRACYTAAVTPIRRQYLEVKRRFPGTIVLFRLGDFSATFDEDECAAGDADQVLGTTIGEEPAHASPAVLERWRLYEPDCGVCSPIANQDNR